MFVDKETWNETWIDNYDAQGKYWKGEMIYPAASAQQR